MHPGSRFSFLHAADLHLDTPFSGLAKAAPAVAELLRDASLASFDALVELALARRVAFVVIAGDLYDGPERGVRAQLRLRDGLRRLSEAAVPCFIVHGNHDPLESGWSAIRSFPPGTTVFPHDRVEVVEVHRDGRLLATVQGISYASRSTSENLARRLERPLGGGEGVLHVGVLHCYLEGSPGSHEAYSPCSLADLRRTGLDYLALGHVHERSVRLPAVPGDPVVVYPGNSQARSWRASERGAKGVVLAHAEDGAVREVEFVATDVVRFEELDCDTSGCADLGELADALDEQAEEALRAAEGRALVLRARLRGAGDAHALLARPGASEELLAHLRDDAAGRVPLLWWDSLHDETAAGGEPELEELGRRGDFAADLVATSLLARQGEPADWTGELTAGLPRPLAQRVAALLEEEWSWPALVDRGTRRAVEELSAEAS